MRLRCLAPSRYRLGVQRCPCTGTVGIQIQDTQAGYLGPDAEILLPSLPACVRCINSQVCCYRTVRYVFDCAGRVCTGMVACLDAIAIAVACLIWTIPLTTSRIATARNASSASTAPLCHAGNTTTGMPRRQLRTDSHQCPRSPKSPCPPTGRPP
jgi:hypothetical protein